MKPFIKPRPASPSGPATATAPAPRISPNELTVFSVAASIADPAERAAYLDRACGSDAAMRARLEERLQARAPQASARPSTEQTPATVAVPAELARASREGMLTTSDRPDALALVPMSAAQFAAAQQPPRHSPIPWAAATILAIAVGALAVFYWMERQNKEQAQQKAELAAQELESAERDREAAATAALEAKTVADRANQALEAAQKEAFAARAQAAGAKQEAAADSANRDQLAALLTEARKKSEAAEAELAKLRAETATGRHAHQLALADWRAKLGAAQLEARAYGEAESNLRQALQARTALKADPWSIVETRAMLGMALMQRSQNAEALTEMEAAASAFEVLGPPANDADRARASAASKRIVQFFTVTGRRREANEWRRRLEAVLAAR